jgi:hypothetical protein
LLLGTAASVWQAVRATQAEEDAVAGWEEAKKWGRAEAEQRAIADGNARQSAEHARRADLNAADALRPRDAVRTTLYVAHMNLIPAAWEAGNVRTVLDLLEKTRPAKGQTNLRGSSGTTGIGSFKQRSAPSNWPRTVLTSRSSAGTARASPMCRP